MRSSFPYHESCIAIYTLCIRTACALHVCYGFVQYSLSCVVYIIIYNSNYGNNGIHLHVQSCGKDTCSEQSCMCYVTFTCTDTWHACMYAVCVHTSLRHTLLGHTLPHWETPSHTGTHPRTLGRTLTHCDTPSHTATHPHTLQHTLPHCDTPSHAEAHPHILRHTLTR